MFRVYTEVQITIAKRQGYAFIAAVGVNLQSELTKFADEKSNETTETITASIQKFMEQTSIQRERLNGYKNNPNEYDLYEASLAFVHKQQNIDFASMEKLLNGFIEALNTSVGTARGRIQSSL
jgi:hypothetical protein